MGHKEAHKVMCGLMHAAMEGPDLDTSGFLQNVGHLQTTYCNYRISQIIILDYISL